MSTNDEFRTLVGRGTNSFTPWCRKCRTRHNPGKCPKSKLYQGVAILIWVSLTAGIVWAWVRSLKG